MKKLVALVLVLVCVLGLAVNAFAAGASSARIKTAWDNAQRAADISLRKGNLQQFASYQLQADKLRIMYFNACRAEGKKRW